MSESLKMSDMVYLHAEVERLLEEAQKKTGKSKSKLLGLSGINVTQYDRYMRELRPFSETMLHAVAESEYFDTTYETLKAWALIDEMGREKALEVLKAMEELE